MFLRSLAGATLCLAMLPAAAHKNFLVPSSTTLASGIHWVSVDAARGNDLFYFNHNAMPVDGLQIVAPDGTHIEPAKLERFRHRAVFEFQASQAGTYRVAVVDHGLRAAWQDNGQNRRWMGPAEQYPQAVPRDAKELRVFQIDNRIETFVTLGAPSDLVPANKGLEIDYLTHPADWVANGEARVRLLLDGKPLAKGKLTVIRGATRYRNVLESATYIAGDDGVMAVRTGPAGLYWMNASTQRPANMAPAKHHNLAYTAVVEVLE